MPVAATEKFAVVLTMFVALCGWLEMEGGTQIVSVATLLVIAPAEFVMTTA